MIKIGCSLVVVAPLRGALSNQGLVAPFRGTKNNHGLVAPLTPYSYPPSTSCTPPLPPLPAPGGWRPAIQLDSELN